MDTVTPASAEPIPPEILADLRAVIDCLVSNQPLAAEVARRIEERSERMTEDLRRQYGELNIAVNLIREIRDEE
jgi:hypothetical protein